MVTCRQCGAAHRDDNVTQCAVCGSTYFRTSDLWDQPIADLGRRMGTDALSGDFPLRALVMSALRIFLGVSAGLALLVLVASRLS